MLHALRYAIIAVAAVVVAFHVLWIASWIISDACLVIAVLIAAVKHIVRGTER